MPASALVTVRHLRNLLTKVPKSAQPWVATLVRTIFDQPAAEEVHAQHTRVVDSLEAKYPDAAAHLDEAKGDLLAFTGFPREIWRQLVEQSAGAAQQRDTAAH